MSIATKNVELENPYYHLRNAEQAEIEGELDIAEMAYKAAVMMSDGLPLAEYRKDFEIEISKIRSQKGYQPAPGVNLEQLEEAYSRLLSLPVQTRVSLGSLFYARGKIKEASVICQEAFDIGVDSLILHTAESRKLLRAAEKLQTGLRRVGDDTDQKSQYLSLSMILRAQSYKKTTTMSPALQAQAELYKQLNIVSDWTNRKRAIDVKHSREISKSSRLKPMEMLSVEANILVSEMYGCAKAFMDDLVLLGRCNAKALTWTDPCEVNEFVQMPDVYGQPVTQRVRFMRCRVSDRFWSLSMRSDGACVELFLVPTHELLNGSSSENDNSIRARFRLRPHGQSSVWMSEGFPVYADEARSSVRSVLKEMIQRSEEFSNGQLALTTQSVIDFRSGGLMKRVSELSQQKVSLAEKLVYQHESVQNRIARDIHDAVIADVLAVKRSFAEGGEPLSQQEVVNSLETVANKLRNICQDLSTRDLQDWGLKTVVKDIVQRTAERCNATFTLSCNGELPNLPYEVQLHLYRIVQECLNNIEKYANSTEIGVRLCLEDNLFELTVEDNGVGFDPSQRTTRKASEGGMGLNTIRERVALIQCFYPAQVWIQSQVGLGTKTTVQINVSRKE